MTSLLDDLDIPRWKVMVGVWATAFLALMLDSAGLLATRWMLLAVAIAALAEAGAYAAERLDADSDEAAAPDNPPTVEGESIPSSVQVEDRPDYVIIVRWTDDVGEQRLTFSADHRLSAVRSAVQDEVAVGDVTDMQIDRERVFELDDRPMTDVQR